MSPDRPADPRLLEQLVLDTWDFDDPAATADRFARMAADTGDRAEAAVLRTQQARAKGLAGDLPAADRLLDEVASGGLDGLTHAQARLAIERGRVLTSTGDPAGAAAYFAEAGRLATEVGAAGLAVDARHMEAIAAGAVRGPGAARVIDEQLLTEVEASDDPQVRRWLGSILNNLGWDLHDSGEVERALAVFERAVDVRAETADHSAWLVARWCVGRTLRTLGRYDEALRLMRELAADPVGAEDPYVHEEIRSNVDALATYDAPSVE